MAYSLPAIRSETCAAVSVAWPVLPLMALLNGTATPALEPGMAGPCRWAAVAGPDRPLWVSVQLSTLVLVSNLAANVPDPLVVTGGTPDAPDRLALKFLVVDEDEGIDIIPQPVMAKPRTEAATVVRKRFIVRNMGSPDGQRFLESRDVVLETITFNHFATT